MAPNRRTKPKPIKIFNDKPAFNSRLGVDADFVALDREERLCLDGREGASRSGMRAITDNSRGPGSLIPPA